MPAPDPQGVISLLQTVAGWDGFKVAGVTTEDAPLPDALGDPSPRLKI